MYLIYATKPKNPKKFYRFALSIAIHTKSPKHLQSNRSILRDVSHMQVIGVHIGCNLFNKGSHIMVFTSAPPPLPPRPPPPSVLVMVQIHIHTPACIPDLQQFRQTECVLGLRSVCVKLKMHCTTGYFANAKYVQRFLQSLEFYHRISEWTGHKRTQVGVDCAASLQTSRHRARAANFHIILQLPQQ